MSAEDTPPNNSSGEDRQFVHFSFYALDPAFRRLPALDQEAARAELQGVDRGRPASGSRSVPTRCTGSAPTPTSCCGRCRSGSRTSASSGRRSCRPRSGGYLRTPYAYLSMTKRSQYVKGEGRSMHKRGQIVWNPDSRYLLIYPMVKTRAWYQLSKPARQGIMNEHIATGHQFPTVKINTTYSFGIDDQEFVVAFETDHVGDFLDLMMALRETEASRYTERDTPIFTCISCTVEEALRTMGGAAIGAMEPA